MAESDIVKQDAPGLPGGHAKHYYGSASATFPVVGTVTVPSPASNYARQMQHIVARAEGFLAGAIHHQHGKGKPAVVFDIDDAWPPRAARTASSR